MKQKILDLILQVSDEFNEQLENKIAIEKGLDAPVYGREGVLDSLGLVSFIIAVEQLVGDEFQVTVTLADEKALSQQNSPFRTIGSLADYIEQLIEDGTAKSG